MSLLTPAEATVLTLLANGRTAAALAVELCVGQRTIYTHRANALRKLGTRDFDQAVVVAQRAGEILPGNIVVASPGQLAHRAAAAEAEVVRLRRELAVEEAHAAREMAVAVVAETKVAAVRALHERDDSSSFGPWCGTCMARWPCQTVRAIDGQLDHSTDARKAINEPSHDSDIREDGYGEWYVSCQDCDARDEVDSEHDAEAWAERHKANPDEVRGLG